MERELQEIRKSVKILEQRVERMLPYIDELEKELKMIREVLMKMDRREEARDAREQQQRKPF